VSAKTKVRGIEPVARLDIGYRCLKCNHALAVVMPFTLAGHCVYQCSTAHCESYEKQLKIPYVTIKGEWL
jgi:hypothetical protein